MQCVPEESKNQNYASLADHHQIACTAITTIMRSRWLYAGCALNVTRSGTPKTEKRKMQYKPNPSHWMHGGGSHDKAKAIPDHKGKAGLLAQAKARRSRPEQDRPVRGAWDDAENAKRPGQGGRSARRGH